MLKFISDPSAALKQRQASDVIAYSKDGVIDQANLMQRISNWMALIQTISGTQVALYIEDSAEFIAALLAAWQLKKTVFLSADTLLPNCQYLQQHVAAFLGDFPDQFAPLKPTTDACFNFNWQELAPEFLALVVFTSGSTGAAQAIPKRMRQLTAEIAALEATFTSRMAHASLVSTVSHQHIYGCLFKILWPLAAGRAIYTQRLHYPEQIIERLQDGPIILVASPAHLKRLPTHLDWSQAKQGCRLVFSSGGPLSEEGAGLVEQCLGQFPIEVYGSSETGGIAWRQRMLESDQAWQLFAGVKWRINTDQLLEVSSDYLYDADWYRTSDRVQASQDGKFLLLGRADRIVKIEEKRISLDALERFILASGLAQEVRLILDQKSGEQRQQLLAFLVLTNDAKNTLKQMGKLAMNQQLRLFLQGKVEPIAIPRRWYYLDSLPVNAQGKTSQSDLLALCEPVAESAASSCQNEVAKTVAVFPIFRVIDQQNTRVLMELFIPGDLLFFDGHFEQMPILPGVVQLDWAIHYGRRYFAMPEKFKEVKALKFQHLIRPAQKINLELSFDAVKNVLTFSFHSPVGQHAGGRIFFEHSL